MRIALTVLVLAALATPAAAEKLPTFPRNTSYEEARSSLQALGWKPAPLPADKRYCTIGREDVCEKYPEAYNCSGTGRALCNFTWRRNDTLIEIVTQGEEVEALGVYKVTCRSGC